MTSRQARRLHLAAAALLCAAAALAAAGRPASGRDARATPARPNILLILTDDLDLELGGFDAMPRVQRLVAGPGTTFSSFFVPISLCCPSRASLLLGRFAHNHLVYSNDPPDGGFGLFQQLGHEDATIATALQAAGYRTALLGKYLNGYPHGVPHDYVPPGWDEWYVPSNGDPYSGFHYLLNENGRLVAYGSTPQDYLTDVLADKAARFIARSHEPFFLYVAPYVPHAPATPAPRHAGLFPGARAPRTPSWNEADVADKASPYRSVPPLTAADVQTIDALYRRRLQSLQAVDEMVERLIATLAAQGRLANTYVVFTSDNGFHMGQHRLRPGKYTAFEEDIRVPLAVRGPGIPAGRTIDALVESIDLTPTFAAWAGARLRTRPDGRSLAALLAGGAAPPGWRQAVLVEQHAFTLPGASTSADAGLAADPASRRGPAGVLEPLDAGDRAGLGTNPPLTFAALRSRNLKYVEYTDGERELFDLRRDPYELQNLQARAPRALLERLSGILTKMRTCAGASCRAADAVPVPSP
jgi:N-acetylglucosamine-6-sulfatase